MTIPMAGTRTRPATRADLARIVEIYNHYVLNTHISFDLEAHTVEDRLEWFSQFADAGRYRLLVAERDGRVVGFASSTRHRTRAAYDPTVETSVYLDRESVAQGVGSSLYRALLELLDREDVHRMLAGIALPNAVSIALHERFGFRPVALFTEQGYKFGRYWDVAWYERERGPQPSLDG